MTTRLSKIFISLVSLLCCSFFVSAQEQQSYRGVVTDNENNPLSGVSVMVAKTQRGTITGNDGRFTIAAQIGQRLAFSRVGYIPDTVALTNEYSLQITLMPSKDSYSALNEVVVIGYGTAKKKDVTGSVSHIGQEVMKTKVATSFIDYLKGNIAGVNVGIDNSAGGGGSIEIRGASSINASTSPLIVLDGAIFYGNTRDINPNDIESIDVLKDASATAIYGSKGSAGVVAITTKRGKTDKPTINIVARNGVGKLVKLPALPTPDQYIQRRLDYLKTLNYLKPNTDNSKKPISYYENPDRLPDDITREQWAAYDPSFSGDYQSTWLTRLQFGDLEINNIKAGKSVDWRDAVYRSGMRQDYDVSFAGKSNKTNYYTSLGYTKNNGFYLGDEFQAVRGRINLESTIAKWLKIGTNTQFANRSDDTYNVDLGNADVMSPFGNMYDSTGKLKAYPTNDARVANPLLVYALDKYFYRAQTLNSNFYGRLTLPFGISFQTSFNNRYGWVKTYSFKSDLRPGITPGGEAERNDFSDYEWIVDNVLNWNYKIGRMHQFNVTLGQSAEKYQMWNSIESNKGFIPNSNLIFHNLNAGTAPVTKSNDEIQTGQSLFGRLIYNLNQKYIVTATVRRDGFSAFGQRHPYGTYPSIAFAWRVSDEPFMQHSPFNDLKLRVSQGTDGNRDIGRYAALANLTLTDNIIGGQNVKGVWQSNIPNYNLMWESTAKTNIGVDFSLLDNRISGTIDAYHTQTSDLVLSRALPQITGYSSVISNLGRIDNKGLEVTLATTNFNIPDKLMWRTTFIFSANRNKIVHLYGDRDTTGKELDDPQSGWYIGHSLFDLLDYKTVGIWQLGQETDAAVYGKQPGDPRVLDVDGDGVITTKDKVWIGSKVPRYRASVRSDLNLFKNINFSFVIRGEFDYWGTDDLPRNEDNRYFVSHNSIMTSYWTPWNATNEFARLGSNISNPNIHFYKRRDYVKMQNASLSYSFAPQLLRKYSLQSVVVSLNVDNPFVITKWRLYDPETMGRVPRIYTLGVDVTL